MRRVALLLAVVVTTLGASGSPALPRSAPEAQGMASSSILAFLEGAEQKVDALHSVMVLRHGQVVAEGWWAPYQRDDLHLLYSLSKSFTSTAVGLAIAEGKMTLDDPVVSFFADEAPAAPSDNLKAMRVRDLLSMSSGHHAEAIDQFPYLDPAVSQTRTFLSLPVAHKPGTHFVYNTPASFMLSAIVQKVTGAPVLEYLRPRLFEPLGIVDATWQASPRGVSLGGFGLSARTEDIARFGQLYLQHGEWNGRQLVPAEWVDAATGRQVSNGSNPASDWDQGYGYQFWRCRHGAFRGDGAFGQYCMVLPREDAVIAITGGLRDMQAVLDLVWQHLWPAMKSAPLAADPVSQARLAKKLAGLTLPAQPGRSTSPTAARVSGRLYELPKNDAGLEAVGLEFGTETTLLVRSGGRDHRVPVGLGGWRRGGNLPMTPGGPVPAGEPPVAASGGWSDADTFAVKACFVETPFCTSLRLRFAGDALVLDREMNVGFGETKRPTLVGLPRRPAA